MYNECLTDIEVGFLAQHGLELYVLLYILCIITLCGVLLLLFVLMEFVLISGLSAIKLRYLIITTPLEQSGTSGTTLLYS